MRATTDGAPPNRSWHVCCSPSRPPWRRSASPPRAPAPRPSSLSSCRTSTRVRAVPCPTISPRSATRSTSLPTTAPTATSCGAATARRRHWSPTSTPGAEGSNPSDLIAFGGTLYLFARDGVHGNEAWQSDGTATTMIADLLAGSDGSEGYEPTPLGDALYFGANDGTHGFELWRLGAAARDDAARDDLARGVAVRPRSRRPCPSRHRGLDSHPRQAVVGQPPRRRPLPPRLPGRRGQPALPREVGAAHPRQAAARPRPEDEAAPRRPRQGRLRGRQGPHQGGAAEAEARQAATAPPQPPRTAPARPGQGARRGGRDVARHGKPQYSSGLSASSERSIIASCPAGPALLAHRSRRACARAAITASQTRCVIREARALLPTAFYSRRPPEPGRSPAAPPSTGPARRRLGATARAGHPARRPAPRPRLR